ncbi:hypothetical protein WAI453_004298 [Rhynchosporium graminicola]
MPRVKKRRGHRLKCMASGRIGCADEGMTVHREKKPMLQLDDFVTDTLQVLTLTGL